MKFLHDSRHWLVLLYTWSRADRKAPAAFVGWNPSRNGVEVGIAGRHLLVAHIS